MGRIQRTSQGFSAITRIIFGRWCTRAASWPSVQLHFAVPRPPDSARLHVDNHPRVDARRSSNKVQVLQGRATAFESKSARYQPFHVYVSKFLVSLCREMNVLLRFLEQRNHHPPTFFYSPVGNGELRDDEKRETHGGTLRLIIDLFDRTKCSSSMFQFI